MSRTSLRLAALTILVTFVPSLAVAQAPKAGVVTTLEGITNTVCGGSCTNINGLNVFLTNSAVAGNVSITTGFIKNSSLGSINLSNTLTTAVIVVDGANTKVTVSGQ